MKKQTKKTTRVNATRKNRDSRSAYKGVTVRKDLRLAVYLRDDFRCLYCLADLRDADPRDITLDHLTPHSKGGSNEAGNLICACRSCNCSRGDQPVSRFASPEARKHIARNKARKIRRYRDMAKALIDGETGEAVEPVIKISAR